MLATVDARGAWRRHQQVVLADRNRRGAGTPRRALADARQRAGAAEPLAHPHRHLPAPRLPQGRSDNLRRLLDYSIRDLHARCWRDARRQRAAAISRRGGAERRRAPAPTGSPPASCMACSTPTTSTSPARVSTTARGGSCRLTIRPLPPPISTRHGLYAFGRQPDALAWNLTRLAECLLPLSTVELLEPALNAFWPAFRSEIAAAILRRFGLAAKRRGGRTPISSPRCSPS